MTINILNSSERTNFGFWMYLMTDFVLFASLFAVYAVLQGNTFGGPTGAQIFNTQFALLETFILLASSFTCGLALLAGHKARAGQVLVWLCITALLGATFVSLEVSEFVKFIAVGNGPSASGFLSAYFTLVGTHGLHVTLGLVWMLALMVAIGVRGLTQGNMRKLELLTMFWHFLELIWIFIFVIVYLLAIV